MKKLIYALMSLALLWTASCSKNEAKFFEDKPSLWLSGDRDQKATTDSVQFSFSSYGEEVQTYVMHLVVNVSGYAAAEDRTFSLEVVADKTNVTQQDYTIGELVVPEGSVKAIIPVTVHRKMSDTEWDLADLESPAARLTFQLVANDNFQLGASERKQYTITWHDRLTMPSQWTVVRSYLGEWTNSRHRFLIDYVGITDFDTFIADYVGKTSRLYGLQARCIRLLNEYNAAHPGKPYWNTAADAPLVFGYRAA